MYFNNYNSSTVRLFMCMLASLGSFNKSCIETTIRLVYSDVEVIIHYVTLCNKASTRSLQVCIPGKWTVLLVTEVSRVS